MKTQSLKSISLKIVVIIAFLAAFILPETTFAQPPKWAPAHGYRAKTKYVYFPEQNFYYDIQARNYFYLNNSAWSVSVAIPTPFININLGVARQVQLDYYGAYPYYYNRDHCTRYKVVKVKKHKPNKVIFIDGGHNHYEKNNDNDHGNRHGNGHGHGKGHGKKH